MVATFHSLGNNVTSYRLALMAARWNGNGAKWLNDGERYVMFLRTIRTIVHVLI